VLTTDTILKLRHHHLNVKTEICEGHRPEVILARAVDLSIDVIALDLANFQALADFCSSYSPSYSTRLPPHASLLVARPSRQIRPLNTILLIDDSLAAWRAVEFMATLSLPQWAKVTVLRVIQEQTAVSSEPELVGAPSFAPVSGTVMDLPDPTTTKVINRLQQCGARVWSSFRFGDPVDEVLAVAREQRADLIVVGVHNQRRDPLGYPNSLTQAIIKDAPCSVLAIH
jgi:nucleotide-binding universal stress UspA family protein